MCKPPSKGFTLLELMVTLVIIATLVGLVAPRLGGALAPIMLASEGRKVAALLRHARSQAVLRNQDAEVRLGGEPPGLSLDAGAVPYRPPQSIQLELRGGKVTAAEAAATAEATIRFYAAGGSSGGAVILSLEDGRQTAVNVDWLSGRVRVDD